MTRTSWLRNTIVYSSSEWLWIVYQKKTTTELAQSYRWILLLFKVRIKQLSSHEHFPHFQYSQLHIPIYSNTVSYTYRYIAIQSVTYTYIYSLYGFLNTRTDNTVNMYLFYCSIKVAYCFDFKNNSYTCILLLISLPDVFVFI